MIERLSPVGTGRSPKRDIEPNHLALAMRDQLQPIVEALYGVSSHLEPQRCCGIEPVRTQAGTHWRPSTNAECYEFHVDLIDFQLVADVRQPIPPQVAQWLREVSAELLATANKIDGIDDDREPIPSPKPRGPRKPALVAGLAGLVFLAGCCQCPPPSVPPSQRADTSIDASHEPRRQIQRSTITVEDRGGAILIQHSSGGNVVSRVTVGPDGKLTVEDGEVSPSKR